MTCRSMIYPDDYPCKVILCRFGISIALHQGLTRRKLVDQHKRFY